MKIGKILFEIYPKMLGGNLLFWLSVYMSLTQLKFLDHFDIQDDRMKVLRCTYLSYYMR